MNLKSFWYPGGSLSWPASSSCSKFWYWVMGACDTQRPIAQQVFELSTKGSNHLVPGANLLNEGFQVALFPETTLVVYLRQATKLSGFIEHGDNGEVALQEVGHATAVGI